MHALVPEFRKVGFHLSLSDPVPDKFQVQHSQGSFRGLSRGVALASLFPVFSPRPNFISDVIWASQRLLYSVIQVGQMPVHVVTLYLYPNAPLSGDKYSLNCKLVSAAVQIVSSINGLAVIAGDFNIHWKKFDDLVDLSYRGWKDSHEAESLRTGEPLENTCKQATRHTFLLCNPALFPFLRSADVSFRFDLDSHAVLRVKFDLPTYNPKVYKWLLPRSFDQCVMDTHSLETYQVPEERRLAFQNGLQSGDLTRSFHEWSQIAEDSLLQHSSLPTGGLPPRARFTGRGALTVPVPRRLSAPRFRFGRPTDFVVQNPCSKLIVRQTQRQARRLQSLNRFFACKQGCSICEVNSLWSAILKAPGFGKSFQVWAREQCGLDCTVLTPVLAYNLFQCVSQFANDTASLAWRARQADFVHALEDSWSNQGGSLPFRMIKESPLPPVLDLSVCKRVRLLPQRWSPYGLEWFKLANPGDFQVGMALTTGDLVVEVKALGLDTIQVSSRLTRRQASELSCAYTTAEPSDWVPHFLGNWEQFWKSEDPVDVPSVQLLNDLPQFPQVHLPPLSLCDWRDAVKSAKTRTMRGIDGWTATELRWLPDSVVTLLLLLFDQVRQSREWPKQLTTWLLILLRKSPVPSPDWSLIRPISVAGLIYRIWSRMQTRRLMAHARSLSDMLVSPALSTKAIWTFLADLISHRISEGRSLCGFVLDIVKCFNVLDRHLLKALFDRFGFDQSVTDQWMIALQGLSRSVLISGYSYGHSVSNTGIPEGDPLSVVGMFVFAYAFSCHMQVTVPPAIVATYADNWEIVVDIPDVLRQAIDQAESFLQAFHLPVAVSKCWSWAVQAPDRRTLRSFTLFGETLPVKLSARDLGADISYCRRRAAKVRNARVVSGHQRLLKLSGLPCPVWRKTRLLLSSVFPHTLHAAETTLVPKTTFQRLRAKVSKGLGLAKKGSSPYLSCLLGTYRCVDPEFVVVMNRVQSFRQVVRELPDLHSFFFRQLNSNASRKGPTALLVQSLGNWGWYSENPGLFQDEFGRMFHLLLTPLAHVMQLLLSSWCDIVASKVKHRKYLESLTNIDCFLSKQVKHLLPAERALLRAQQIGAFYSGEYTRHIHNHDELPCRFCGAPDSRLHRLWHCPHVQPWKSMFPNLIRAWDDLDQHTACFGLWEEPRLLRAWQGLQDSVSFPVITRVVNHAPIYVYSDGACLKPGQAYLRLAAAAVIQAHDDGTFSVLWRGPLPTSHQTPYRSELLAAAVAFRSGTKVQLFSDCKAMVGTASRLIESRRLGILPVLPRSNLDLWAYFLESLDGLDLSESGVTWIKGHVAYASVVGLPKVHAWFNHWVDQVAKQTLLQLAGNPVYCDLCSSFRVTVSLARDLASYQAGVGMMFAGEHDAPVTPSMTPVLEIHSPEPTAGFQVSDVPVPPTPRPDFCSALIRWFETLSFVPSVQVIPHGVLEDIAWIEFFWIFVSVTGIVPPFRYNGDWVSLRDDPAFHFVLPPFLALFRTWKRSVDVLQASGVLSVPWGRCKNRVSSLPLLGSRFSGAGFGGRVVCPLSTLQQFTVQLCAAPRISALRLPAVVN